MSEINIGLKMIRSLIAAIFSTLILTSCLAAQRIQETVTEPSNAGFVPNLPDVPMPQHFIADASTSSFFDSAEGRIAEINAEGFVEDEEYISEFFDETLPQFGWIKIDRLVYKKEGEILLITEARGKTITSLKFQLRPSL